MQVIQLAAEMQATARTWREENLRIGFVPTMGNLHAGHLSLIDSIKPHCDKIVVSIFVNPMQFNAQADFATYPRTLGEDLALLETLPVDAVFTPDDAQIYPHGLTNTTSIDVPELSQILEGAHRADHFRGVATVVNILFHIVKPNTAIFGEKDYQQLLVIQTMVRDLYLPIKILSTSTCREQDGLAMSSRNQRLTASERALAPLLYKTLQQLKADLLADKLSPQALEQKGMQILREKGFVPDYVAIRDAKTLAQAGPDTRQRIILVAAHLGVTRLIDNLAVDSD